MQAAGLKNPAALEELENHLREDIRVLLSAGKPEDQAFQLAVPRLGMPGQLRTEFNKLKPPTTWPVTIGFWLYGGAMMAMAACLSNRLLEGRWNLLLYAHVVIFTAGYCAAIFAGCLGILYVCYRLFQALSPGRRQSLVGAAFLFSHLSAGLTAAGAALGMLWSRKNLGGYFGGSMREIVPLCATLLLVALLVALRIGGLSERAKMLLCIGGNVVVGLAWLGPFMILGWMARYWPLAIFVGLNIAFLVIGVAPASESAES